MKIEILCCEFCSFWSFNWEISATICCCSWGSFLLHQCYGDKNDGGGGDAEFAGVSASRLVPATLNPWCMWHVGWYYCYEADQAPAQVNRWLCRVLPIQGRCLTFLKVVLLFRLSTNFYGGSHDVVFYNYMLFISTLPWWLAVSVFAQTLFPIRTRQVSTCVFWCNFSVKLLLLCPPWTWSAIWSPQDLRC